MSGSTNNKFDSIVKTCSSAGNMFDSVAHMISWVRNMFVCVAHMCISTENTFGFNLTYVRFKRKQVQFDRKDV